MRTFYKLQVKKNTMGNYYWFSYKDNYRVDSWHEENAQMYDTYEFVKTLIKQLKQEGYISVKVYTYFVDINEIVL